MTRRCGNCGEQHQTAFKCCETCRLQWRIDKPSKRSANKDEINSIINELSQIHGSSRIINRLATLRENL